LSEEKVVVSMTPMYVGHMTNWTKNLFSPSIEVREHTAKEIPTAAVVAGTALFAEVFGSEASMLDKAAFVAYPLVVREAAKYGAHHSDWER
jgi:hypothetical protein